MNLILAFLGKYLRPIETYAYSFLGIVASGGVGVSSASASTSALVASFPATIHLVKEVVEDIRDAYLLLTADLKQVRADLPAVRAEVPTSTAGLLAKVESVVAATEQLPGA